MDNNTKVFFRFREFPVYKDARRLRKELKELSKTKFPKEEDFVLRPQLWRALDSVILNIAEGSDRHSDKDFSHFLNTSLGSINEVVGCLDCALDNDYLTNLEHQKYLERSENIARQLKAFLSKVRKDNKRF
jgi:four helix bundle protein